MDALKISRAPGSCTVQNAQAAPPDTAPVALTLMDRLRILFHLAPTEIVETLMGLVAVLLGLSLCLQPVRDRANLPVSLMLSRLAPEWVWGSVFVLAGLAVFVALAVEGRAAVRVRRYLASALGALWSMLTFLLVLVSPHRSGVPAYLVLALFAAWTVLRLGSRLCRDGS